MRELIDWGARFDRDADGAPALGREAAHSVRRVLHARDATGREIGRVLWERVARLRVACATIDARAGHRARRRGRALRRRRAIFDADGDVATCARARDAARDRRRRAGLPRDDEPARRDRRRHRAGVSTPARASPISSSSSSIRPR